MSTTTPLSCGRGLPDLSVVEFCVMIALMRLGPQPAPALLPTVSDWFGWTVSLSDIEPAVRRLIHQQLLLKGPHGTLRARPAATTPVSNCLTALVRLVGTEIERALKKADPPMRVHLMKKTAETKAVEREEALRKRLGKPNMTDAQREVVREQAREAADEKRKAKGQTAAGVASNKAQGTGTEEVSRQDAAKGRRKGKAKAKAKDSKKE